MLVDWHTIKVEDFDECSTQFNRCKARDSVICENLPGSFQCRCMKRGKKKGRDKTVCQDPCLMENGDPY